MDTFLIIFGFFVFGVNTLTTLGTLCGNGIFPIEREWRDPKEVEDWEFECAAALTASSIDDYDSGGKETATKILTEYLADTTLIGEEQSTKIHMLLLHSSMIGFENYFLYDQDLGGNESIKLTDEIVLKAFSIDSN